MERCRGILLLIALEHSTCISNAPLLPSSHYCAATSATCCRCWQLLFYSFTNQGFSQSTRPINIPVFTERTSLLCWRTGLVALASLPSSFPPSSVMMLWEEDTSFCKYQSLFVVIVLFLLMLISRRCQKKRCHLLSFCHFIVHRCIKTATFASLKTN